MGLIRRGWRGDEEGWWYWNSSPGDFDYFKVKVTERGEEILLGLAKEKSDLQLPDVLQYATHLEIATTWDELPSKFKEVLQTAADPVPALEALTIGRGVECRPLWNAMKSKKLSDFKALQLSRPSLDHEDVQFLATAFDSAGLPSLKDLILDYNAGIRIINLAKVMESGRMLSLYKTKLGDDGCEPYANAMSSGRLPSLKCINFGNNSIGIRGMEALGRAIESGALKNLTELDLCWNRHIGEDDGGRGHFILAEHMGSGRMRALEKLNLSETGMGDERCEAYAEAMISGELPSLCCIDFWSNQIGNRGAEALGRTIRSGKLKNLAKLDLPYNNIAEKGIIVLANSFHEGEASTLPNLRSLDFNENPFTEVGLRSLAEALKSGRLNSLDQLHLRYSSVRSEEGGAALVSAFSSNIYLTVDVRFEWEDFPALGRRVEQLRKRNQRNKDISAGLKASPKVPAAFGKIYICGDPEVGKTTLRKALPRTRRQSLLMREGRHQVEERTRGIDVSQFSSKETKPGENPITLLVWDMAGQEDYHLVHNAFFPDLSSAEGKATSFVVVCSSKKKGDESKQVGVDYWLQQLEYWLKFIASSCGKSTDRRHVFVVLNNFHRESKVWKYEQHWKRVLEHLKDDFKDYLDIQTDSFIMDVRKRRSIQPLKTRLLNHSRNLLRNEMVPDICQFIQKNLTDWSKTREHFPVLRWAEFVVKVHESLSEPWPIETLEAGTKYLNEAGVVIYIDKEAPSDWNIHFGKLVVLNPSWFCNKIVGNMFLRQDMGHPTDLLFRKRVNPKTGSISESEFRRYFKPLLGMENEWNDDNFGDLIAILLWLGLCYRDRGEILFIPSLIAENTTVRDDWEPAKSTEYKDDQWVMGFSVEHSKSKVALAPIALWHRFQVVLAQTPKFNGHPDNNFVIGKYFMSFCVDHMKVLIEIGVDKGSPTFEDINIFVKPLWKVEALDGKKRKQCQVDLACDLSEILFDLWIEVCPGVEYVHRVVWPWPASQYRLSQSSPRVMSERNMEVADVKKSVQEHGLGRLMHWPVGSCTINEDQLLSTKDKKDVVEKYKEIAQDNLHILTQCAREAVEQGICLVDVLTEDSTMAGLARSTTGKLLMAKLEKIERTVNTIEDLVRDGFKEVLNKERELVRRLQDTGEFILQDNERTCPRFIYLGEKNSDGWMTLKEALSLKKTVRLHFFCEARYNDYRQHAVTSQQGLDLSEFKDWAKKIGPWLKVSLAILFISAKVAANLVLPGVGWIVPDFTQWQQASSLSEGIALATAFSKEELDKHIMEGMGLDANDTHQNPRELNGRSRRAISEFLETLTPDDYEKKLGLRKVRLSYDDGSHGVVWICRECFLKYRGSDTSKEVVFELKF